MTGMQAESILDEDDDGYASGLVISVGVTMTHYGDSPSLLIYSDGDEESVSPDTVRPDLDHAGTLGFIEHILIPMAWPAHKIQVHRHDMGHEVFIRDSGGCVWSSGWVPGLLIGETLLIAMDASP